jgi:hypothetical protein
VAHELGHAWEEHVGYVDSYPETVLGNELFADCIAGAVVAATYAEGERAARLIQEAASDAYSAGDFVYDAQHHGTPAQRRDATLLGARDGHVACDAYLRSA